MLRFTCPGCGMQLSAPEECAGRSSRCRACGQAFQIPVPVASIVAAPPPPTPEPPITFIPYQPPAPESDAPGLTGIILSSIGLGFAVLAWFACGLGVYLAAPLCAAGALVSSFSRTDGQKTLGIILGLVGLALSVVGILVLKVAVADLLDRLH